MVNSYSKYVKSSLELQLFREDESGHFFLKEHPRIIELYLYMRSYVIRRGWKDLNGIELSKYYINNLLVFSRPVSVICNQVGISATTFNKLIGTMFMLGWINIKHKEINTKNSFNKQNLYILGEWIKTEDNKIIESFYADVLLMNEGDRD